jgi:hypothetical protein
MDENFIKKHAPRLSLLNRPKLKLSVTVTLGSLVEIEGG